MPVDDGAPTGRPAGRRDDIVRSPLRGDLSLGSIRGWFRARLAVVVSIVVVMGIVAGCNSGGPSSPSVGSTRAGSSSKPPRVEPREKQLEVRIDLSVRYQTIDGFGVSERPWTDPHVADAPQSAVPASAQGDILDDLVKGAGMTRMRAILDPPADAATALQLPPKVADDQVAVIRQARARGLRLFYAAPESLAPWMRRDPEGYVDWILAVMLRWKELGAELRWFSPINEPANARAGDLPPGWLVGVVALLGERMRAAGLSTQLVIPDDLNPAAANSRAAAVLADDRARPFVGALAYHLYTDDDFSADIAALRDLGDRYGLPVWMSEYSANSYAHWPGALGWATTVHELLTEGGVSAVDYLWGFFGSQEQPHTLISMRMDDGRYLSHAKQPVYHLTAQYARFVRPGCVRVNATSPGAHLLVTAFACPNRSVVVVVVNTGLISSQVRFAMSGQPDQPAAVDEMTVVRTSAEEEGETLEAIAVSASSFSTIAPGQSVTTFVGRNTG